MKINVSTLCVIAGLVALAPSNAWAIDEITLSDQGRAYLEELKTLQSRNPQVFRQEIQKRTGNFRRRLEQLREKDSAAFRDLMGKRRGESQRRLAELGREDPERFRQAVKGNRDQLERRVQYLKETRPEQFDQFRRKQGRALRAMKDKNPQRFEQFVKTHPELRERLHQVHSEAGGPGKSLGSRPPYQKSSGMSRGPGDERRVLRQDQHSTEATPKINRAEARGEGGGHVHRSSGGHRGGASTRRSR